MTKKDYQRAVEQFRIGNYNGEELVAIYDFLVKFFSSDNPKFDRNKFHAACQIEQYLDCQMEQYLDEYGNSH